MVGVSIRVEGLDELTRQLEQLETKLSKRKTLLYKAMFFATKPMADDIKRRAPKAAKKYYRYYRKNGKSRVLQSPGKLKKSIKRMRVKLDESVGVGIYSGLIKHGEAKKYQVFYWRFLERGTPRMPAIPFIQPAFDMGAHDALERFKDRYRDYIEEIMNDGDPESGGD